MFLNYPATLTRRGHPIQKPAPGILKPPMKTKTFEFRPRTNITETDFKRIKKALAGIGFTCTGQQFDGAKATRERWIFTDDKAMTA